MGYTMSKDGVIRQTVHIRLRLSREDIEDLKELAKAKGNSGWRSIIEEYGAFFLDWVGEERDAWVSEGDS